jgi:hypothetical protein
MSNAWQHSFGQAATNSGSCVAGASKLCVYRKGRSVTEAIPRVSPLIDSQRSGFSHGFSNRIESIKLLRRSLEGTNLL